MRMYATYDLSPQSIRGLRIWLWIAGLATILFGVVGIAVPYVMTLAAELLFGAMLASLGALQIIRAVFSGDAGSRIWAVLFGATALAVGVVLLLYPLEGALTLTIVLATFFVVGGVLKLFGAWRMSPRYQRATGWPGLRGWGWLALSGVFSVLLGVLLFMGLPSSASWALGLLLGVDLLFLGATEIALAIGLSQPRTP